MADAILLRPATVHDVHNIAQIFLAGVALSLPHRNLAELYDYERDITEPDGRLWKRVTNQLTEETVICVEEAGKTVGYASWTEPKIVQDQELGAQTYQPGEITFLFLEPSVHGRGLGSHVIKHIQASTASTFRQLYASSPELVALRPDQELVVVGLFCFTKNNPGIRVYQRRGFVPVSTKMHEPSQEELTWMEWRQFLNNTMWHG